MKNKGKLFLYIAMICLCICSMAFGIYSAKKAQLNVSGSIGFIAHDLNVTWSGTISNAIDKSNNVYTDGDITEETSIDKTWTLGNLYFNDIDNYIQYANGKTFPKSIVATIKLYNYSAFPIKAICSMADQEQIESKGVTVDFENNPLIPQAVEQDITPSIGEVKIKFTLRQDNEIDASQGVELASFGTITIDVSQTINQTTEIKYGEVYISDTYSYNAYYVEFGEHRISYRDSNGNAYINAGDPIKCVIYKIIENDVEVTINSFDDVGNYVVNVGDGKYKAKDGVKYYCYFGFADYGRVYYSNNFYYDVTENLAIEGVEHSKNEYGQVWTDYATSNVRFYLDGITVKQQFYGSLPSVTNADVYDQYGNSIYSPGMTNRNFYDDYKLTENNLFNKIQEETLTDFAGTYYTSISQKFWMFTDKEVDNILNLGCKGLLGVSSPDSGLYYLLSRSYDPDSKGLIVFYSEKQTVEQLPVINGYAGVVGFAFEG